MTRRLAALALLPLLAACASSTTPQPSTLNGPATPTAAAIGPGLAPPSLPAPAGCVSAAPVAPAPAGSTTDLARKPVVRVPSGPPPCGLQVMDIVAGTGAAAQAGQQLTVKYVGVLYAGGSEFDSSWKRNSTFPFTLGASQVIPGWDQGLVGMKVGGRRELVIPADLGYGAQGSGTVIPPDAALIFVVDLVKVA